MGSIVLKSLSILLGVFFIFVGITKLTPFISKELHKDLVSTYLNLYCSTVNTKIKRSVGALRIWLRSVVLSYFRFWLAA